MPSVQLIEEIVRKVLAESGLNTQGIGRQAPTGPRYLILADSADKKSIARQLPKPVCPVFLEKGLVTPEDILDG